MNTLIVTRGLPASGKSTRAIAWVAEDSEHRARVNRDLLRLMMHGRRMGDRPHEDAVTVAAHAAIAALLQTGRDVVVDDTNLNPNVMENLGCLALAAGAKLVVWDMTDVTVDECVRRDLMRPPAQSVGEDVIRGMHAKYLAPVR
jgi:predicted kinase